MENLTLVLRFNAFSGKLNDAYWMQHETRKRTGQALLTASEAYAYLAKHPQTRCAPTEV